jgi:hypothetical protein
MEYKVRAIVSDWGFNKKERARRERRGLGLCSLEERPILQRKEKRQ